MNEPIDISPNQRKELLGLINRYLPNVEVWAFGSRVKWTARSNSDLDLVAFAKPEAEARVSLLKEALEESSLPFKVDFLVWDNIPESFQRNIRERYVVLVKAKEGGPLESVESHLGWRQATWGDEISLEYGKALRGYENAVGSCRVFGSNGPVGWTVKPLVKGPGVILGRKGAYRGVQYSENDFFVIDTAYYVVPKTDLDMRWLYYAIQYHKLGKIDDGSPIPSTTRAAVYVRELDVPPKEVQKDIARVLGAIDDKIALNRRINQTLEAMAQAIFKSWFVDFDPVKAKIAAKQEGRDPLRAAMSAISGKPEAKLDALPREQYDQLAATAALFPDEIEESELGEIPRGWGIRPMPECIEVNPTRQLKKGVVAPYLDMANVPTNSSRAQTVVLREFASGSKFINGDTLLARITPCLENGKTAFVDFLDGAQVGWGSTEFIVLRPKNALPVEFAYFLCRQPEFRAFAIAQMAGTSGRQRVPNDCFANYLLAVPSSEVASAFGMVACSVMNQIRAHDDGSKTLATLRDTLLPKLLSGELSVTDATAEAEA